MLPIVGAVGAVFDERRERRRNAGRREFGLGFQNAPVGVLLTLFCGDIVGFEQPQPLLCFAALLGVLG